MPLNNDESRMVTLLLRDLQLATLLIRTGWGSNSDEASAALRRGYTMRDDTLRRLKVEFNVVVNDEM